MCQDLQIKMSFVGVCMGTYCILHSFRTCSNGSLLGALRYHYYHSPFKLRNICGIQSANNALSQWKPQL